MDYVTERARVVRRSLMIAVASTALVAAGASDAAAQCRGADSMATRMVAKYTNMLSKANTDGGTRLRLSMMGLPQPPSTVTLVTDKAICRKAEQAYSSDLRGNGNTPSGSVYVLKVGTAYVVRDPAQRGGDYMAEMVLDSAYRIKYRLAA